MTIDKNSSLALGITERTATATTTKNDSKKISSTQKEVELHEGISVLYTHILPCGITKKKRNNNPKKG